MNDPELVDDEEEDYDNDDQPGDDYDNDNSQRYSKTTSMPTSALPTKAIAGKVKRVEPKIPVFTSQAPASNHLKFISWSPGQLDLESYTDYVYDELAGEGITVYYIGAGAVCLSVFIVFGADLSKWQAPVQQ